MNTLSNRVEELEQIYAERAVTRINALPRMRPYIRFQPGEELIIGTVGEYHQSYLESQNQFLNIISSYLGDLEIGDERWERSVKRKTRLPEIEIMDEVEEDCDNNLPCCICMCNKKICHFIPCNHVDTCYTCCKKMVVTNPQIIGRGKEIT